MSIQSKKKSRGGRPSKRDFILECAERLVQKRGAAHLTFDALTEATGISKGGLLYHFESKDVLIQAMLTRYIAQREARRNEILGERTGPDAEIDALIQAELAHSGSSLAIDSAILAAIATNPSLLEPMRDKQLELFRILESSSVGTARARVAWYAVMGHRLCKQFGIANECTQDDAAFEKLLRALVNPAVDISLTDDQEDSVFG
ncbi:MAG: TetR/AcrR family transcriptional regulator [Idiomarina sp.]|nr:TetR/AcrR family transcriptional regulator [Idiomarina sp.]